MDLLQLAWIFTIISMAGAALNAHGKVHGFYLWLVSNTFFMYLDYERGIYAQTFLYFYFICNCIYGIYKWRDHDEHIPTLTEEFEC